MSGSRTDGDVAGGGGADGGVAGGGADGGAGSGGYALGGFADRERELSRLELQARRLVGMHEGAYRRAGLLDAPFVLDVGAGSGAPARFLREAGVETLCVDVDRSILRHAPRPALVARADRLPLPARSVPAVHTRLMLQHVPDPAAVLAELHRVTTPGGALLALDTDHASFIAEPTPPRCEAARQTWIARTLERGADPFVGRRLRALALGAGWDDVKVEAATLTSDDIGPEAFAELLLLPYLHATSTDPEALAAGRAEAGEWAAAPGSFAMATLLVLSARRRPEASAS